MRKLMKKYLKNEEGLTLIELLVVVVILGIIAGIAVLSIGGILDNSKKDAHVANAQQMVNSAKMWVTGNANGSTFTGNTETLTLQKLYDENLIDPMRDPDSKADYADKTNSKVVITKSGSQYTYRVTLKGIEKEIISKLPSELDRSAVTKVQATNTGGN
ncbi:type II secretion system protein [Fictibacillus sp. KU28468]|uniref:type II secretion system protein n=1 Tax=Fictibacillus sp. KU28468 TaxID=2991053 RepID=UPI00223E2390|nr:type II secretion system protein [Fictibacillus sp. KU28468]UZJ80418.1 type II secretion system GspH family protein [Fictibacillus sp. KU28468]